jgi:hypothetical protein
MHTEIKFHENKINDTSNEEDIKMRENKMKQLQKDLFETRKNIEQMDAKINLQTEIVITK